MNLSFCSSVFLIIFESIVQSDRNRQIESRRHCRSGVMLILRAASPQRTSARAPSRLSSLETLADPWVKSAETPHGDCGTQFRLYTSSPPFSEDATRPGKCELNLWVSNDRDYVFTIENCTYLLHNFQYFDSVTFWFFFRGEGLQ